jgi:exopolysaccharide biosynthesis polyprenyl glycosylphosphotransferase
MQDDPEIASTGAARGRPSHAESADAVHAPARTGPGSCSPELSGRAMQRQVKRTIDVVLSAALLLATWPAVTFIALMVKASSPGPIIFRQRRIGRHGQPFTIYKFRTMAEDSALSGPGAHRYDELRVTGVGRFLRKTSLDELPQLWNVLEGNMSLVGPRPDLPHHVERYTPAQRQRLEMRPGITGWAQVNGRNQITWAERIELDVDYVRRWSLLLDLEIIVRTLLVVLAGKGADATVRRRGGTWTAGTKRRADAARDRGRRSGSLR